MLNLKNIIKKIKNYGLINSICIVCYFVISKLIIKNSRLIRLPIYIRGKQNITFGINFTCGRYNRIETFCDSENEKKILVFGENVQINDYNHISAIESVVIGDDVLIASQVFISDHNHGIYHLNSNENPYSKPIHRKLDSKPIKIGNRVWIGESVCVLPGVHIGEGSIIGAGSVVTKNIDSNCIAIGNPAKVIRKWDEEKGIWVKI